MYLELNGQKPTIGNASLIAETATLIGDVEIADCCAIWPGSVLRADLAKIKLGTKSNVQDNAVLHVTKGLPTILGHHVTIGHGAVVHACTIGDNCLIGMNSVIMDGAVIGSNVIIGAMTLIGNGQQIPDGVMVVGIPGRIVRPLTEKELQSIEGYAERNYQNASENYLQGEFHQV